MPPRGADKMAGVKKRRVNVLQSRPHRQDIKTKLAVLAAEGARRPNPAAAREPERSGEWATAPPLQPH